MRRLLLLATFCVLGAAARGENWTDFRGPTQDGHIPPTLPDGTERDLPTEWSEEKNVLWKTPIHGRAWSTPAVWEGTAWLTTASEDGKTMSVVAVDIGDGRVLHDAVVFTNEEVESLGNPVNSYGSPSPAIEEGRVYVHFGSYGTAAIDTGTKDVLWTRRDLPCRHFRGPGSSPVLFKDLLILTMDGVDHQYLVGLDKDTGDTVWRTDRSTEWNDLDANGHPKGDGDFRKAYSTPYFIELGGETIMLSSGSKATWAYDPATGEELWQVRYDGFSNASRPVHGGGMVFINTGYGRANLMAVKLDPEAKGDITDTHVKWVASRAIPKRSSPIHHAGKLYFVDDYGVITRLDAESGEEDWKGRLGGNYSASPIISNGLLYFFSEGGRGIVVKAGDSFEQLRLNELEAGLMCSPVVIGNTLLLRTKTHLYRIGEKG